jgi:hypothetical protein
MLSSRVKCQVETFRQRCCDISQGVLALWIGIPVYVVMTPPILPSAGS